jgi:signal transduction histidine kinase
LQDDTASDGVQSARRIERIRRSTTALSFGLDAFCLAITAIFAGVTVRAVRRHARLIEARSHELEQFAGRVAHDLRSPLSPVLHALQMTSRATPAGDPGRAVVDRAIRCMGRVTTLIDDLLGFARTGGRIDPSARANVLDVTRAAVDDARAQAESQSIDLRIEPHLTDAVVACPSGVLTSLVSNLVRNAIKYMGPARERRIVVRIARLGGDVRIDVSDTGPGLLAGDVDRIFEPYVRADRSGQPGLGLGLATVKRFADAYGGRVGVRSGPTGCTFWFELPLAADPS